MGDYHREIAGGYGHASQECGECGSIDCGGHEYDEYDDEFLIDGVGFADPGGRSALRAETPDNPRDQPCPTCKTPTTVGSLHDRLREAEENLPTLEARNQAAQECLQALEAHESAVHDYEVIDVAVLERIVAERLPDLEAFAAAVASALGSREVAE